MPFGHVVDIESLVAPVNEDTPQGIDIREDRSPTSDYYTIKDARNAARAAERSAMFGGDDEVDVAGPWDIVQRTASKILTESSKDLEVASWYLESLVRSHGISGLRDGLSVINQLIDNFWDDVYPLPDEDGIETRVAPLTGLNGDGGDGTLLAPLRNIEITVYGDKGAFSYYQYLQARDADKIDDDDKKSGRIASLGYSLAEITDTIAATDLLTCQNFVTTLEECAELYKNISSTLREKCGAEAPPSSKITELLAEIVRTTRFIYKPKLDEADAASAAVEAEENAAAAEGAAADASAIQGGQVVRLVNGTTGPITNREEALKRLEEVAKYFRQYEPHTPLAPGLERLISWGRMTVAELMMELIPDSNARGLFSQFTGVKMDGSDESTYVAPPAAPAAPAASEAAATPAAEAVPQAEPEPKSDTSW